VNAGAATAKIADRLIAAWDDAAQIAPITAGEPGFDIAAAYAVLDAIERRRIAQGWRPLGRKIGFTNRTIWARYGVFVPMWAHVWDRTVQRAPQGSAALSLAGLVEPRIEPEVVFGLSGPIAPDADALAALHSVEWIAAGFEIVQSHFPGWKFAAPDCTAAFGLHGALVVGAPVALSAAGRAAIADRLPAFELTLRRGGATIDVGVGANVLDSPALALVHLARVLAAQPQFPPLAAGEIVTTGTVTDAWPVAPGETWTADYGTLGLPGLALTFVE
jgi:2-oxo-3-hexenedioate decarboxylase